MNCNPLILLARLARFERATAWFVARHTTEKKQILARIFYGEILRFRRVLSVSCERLRGTYSEYLEAYSGEDLRALDGAGVDGAKQA